jgi:cyclic pyranopterin phosphate synthase
MALIDTHGRVHNNLRISVTDRCNIRCFYCMPDGWIPYGPREDILTFEEIERVTRVAVRLGVDKIRLTGGEPLLRRGLADLVGTLRAIDGVRDISLTTNGVLLERDAQALYDAGLHRINIHLDTLDRARFEQITRRDELGRVLAGIDACLQAGYRIKINAVALKGITEPDIIPLARFGRERGIEMRFIEFMPLDAQGIWDVGRVLTGAEILEMLTREIGPLREAPDQDPRTPASEFEFADGAGRVGIIASVTKPFCLSCNRIRLTADGHLRYCLFAHEETNLKSLLRGDGSDEQIADAIRATVSAKWLGHEINKPGFVPPPRPMYAIGG